MPTRRSTACHITPRAVIRLYRQLGNRCLHHCLDPAPCCATPHISSFGPLKKELGQKRVPYGAGGNFPHVRMGLLNLRAGTWRNRSHGFFEKELTLCTIDIGAKAGIFWLSGSTLQQRSCIGVPSRPQPYVDRHQGKCCQCSPKWLPMMVAFAKPPIC